jgi:hypothetical protein
VKANVIKAGDDFEIADRVVRSIPVAVMDMFVRRKRPSNVLLHDDSVFKDPFSLARDCDVAIRREVAAAAPVRRFLALSCPSTTFHRAVSGHGAIRSLAAHLASRMWFRRLMALAAKHDVATFHGTESARATLQSRSADLTVGHFWLRHGSNYNAQTLMFVA